MKGVALGVLAAVSVAGLSTGANAAVIINDNFDGYATQAAFEAVWTPIGTVAPLSGTLSTAQAVSAPQSVRNPGTATSNQSRNQRTFAESGSIGVGDKIIWSFDFYDSATGSPNNPQRNYSNLQDGTGPSTAPPNQLISMGLNNNELGVDSGGQFYMARILGFAHTAVDPDGGPNEIAAGTSSGAYFKLNDFGVGGRTQGWHNLKVIISTDNTTQGADFEFYVDNALAERVSNVGDATALRSYDNIRMGSGLSNGSTEAFYDNMYLEFVPVPEPATAGLALVAGAGLMLRRRRD